MLTLFTTLAVAFAAVAAQVDDSAIVAKLLTANSQATKIADLPVGVESNGFRSISYIPDRLIRNMFSIS
jgi:hypothetical protein